MKKFYFTKFWALLSAITLLSVVPATLTVTSDPFDDTEVSVSPASQLVGASEDFSISIYCEPGQPIKAFEFKLSFDETLVTAIDVSEGGIFNGFTTFFSSGTIDNSSGTIINVFGLILGAGNTSGTGSLAIINFTSKSTTGLASLNLYEVGVTNETEYVSIGLTNGSVQVDVTSPVISGLSADPATQEISGSVNVSATVTDNIALDSVYVKITYPDASSENISIISNNIGNTYYLNQSYAQSGIHSYKFWAADTAGNTIESSSSSFLVGDMTSPVISNVLLLSSSPLDTDSSFGWVNVSCEVTDNIAVDEVYLNITNPDGSWNNISMNQGAGSSYFLNSSTAFTDIGNFSYFIWAADNEKNTDTSSASDFSMPPNWDIDSNGVINVVDLVQVSNHYDEDGTAGWIREDVDNNGVIEVLDLVQISNHYSEIWWE